MPALLETCMMSGESLKVVLVGSCSCARKAGVLGGGGVGISDESGI